MPCHARRKEPVAVLPHGEQAQGGGRCQAQAQPRRRNVWEHKQGRLEDAIHSNPGVHTEDVRLKCTSHAARTMQAAFP